MIRFLIALFFAGFCFAVLLGLMANDDGPPPPEQ